MNKCGECQWLETAEGKPYYCAAKDLYTIRMLSIEACDEFKKRVKKIKKIVIWGDVNE